MREDTKIFFVCVVLVMLLILSSGCSTITSITDSFKSINLQSQAPVQKVNYNYQTPTPSSIKANVTENVTVNTTPTAVPRFVYV